MIKTNSINGEININIKKEKEKSKKDLNENVFEHLLLEFISNLENNMVK